MITFSHLGIPTTIKQENETYLEGGKLYITDFDTNPYGVEWLRFEDDSPLPELMRTVPHVAFKVDDLEKEVEGKEILIEPHVPWEGIRVAFIIYNGIPIEFVQETAPTEPKEDYGLEYHHVGIATDKETPNQNYLKEYKIYHTNFDGNPYGVEMMRYEPECTLPEKVKTLPHVAFKVKDLDAALKGQRILIEPNSPSPGVRVAFIEYNGAPVELLQYDE